jgi:carboxylesterase type B
MGDSFNGGAVGGKGLQGLLGGMDMSGMMNMASGASEDCLFLDVYVPGKALKGGSKLPVVNWLYGGAYLIGSKDTADGAAIVKASKGNVIYVGGNYRVRSIFPNYSYY